MKNHSGKGIALIVAALVLTTSSALADRTGHRSVADSPSARFASLSESAEFSDASVTERVRSKLATNSNTRDLQIFVDTKNRVVRLRGQVWSSEERDLAELLARNTEAVAEVRNDLIVRERSIVTR